MKKHINTKASQIAYSDFLSFPADRFAYWWLENILRWIETPLQENLFSPVTEIAAYRDRDIFHGIGQVEKEFPPETKLNCREGLCKALDIALGEANMDLSAVLIQAANSSRYNEVQRIVCHHLAAKNTIKWFAPCFDGFKRNGSFFDALLDNIKEATSASYSVELLKGMDNLLGERGNEYLNYHRVQALFLTRIRLEKEHTALLTERFIKRVNLFLENKRIDWDRFTFNISILMKRFDREQLEAIKTAARQWQEGIKPETIFPYELPGLSKDTANIDYCGAPWLFWAIAEALEKDETQMRIELAVKGECTLPYEKTKLDIEFNVFKSMEDKAIEDGYFTTGLVQVASAHREKTYEDYKTASA